MGSVGLLFMAMAVVATIIISTVPVRSHHNKYHTSKANIATSVDFTLNTEISNTVRNLFIMVEEVINQPCRRKGKTMYDTFFCARWIVCRWNEEKNDQIWEEFWCPDRNKQYVIREDKAPYCKNKPKDGSVPEYPPPDCWNFKWPPPGGE